MWPATINGSAICMLILTLISIYQPLALCNTGQHHQPYHHVYHVVQSTEECNGLITYSNVNDTGSLNVGCNTLQFFISNVSAYFTSNTTFHIAEGHHILDSEGLQIIRVNDIHDLILFGQGRGITVIECGRNTKGFQFINSNGISIIGIDLINCGQAEQNTPTIRLFNSQSVMLEQTGIIDSHIGMIAVSSLSVSIVNSSFINITRDGIFLLNTCNMTVISTNFVENDIGIEAQNSNSALCSTSDDTATLVMDCIFEHNRNKAIDFRTNFEIQLQVSGSYFYQNGEFNDTTFNAAVFVSGSVSASILIMESRFIRNLNRAIYVQAASLTLKLNVFVDNTVVVYSPFFGGSALTAFNNNQLNITDCVFVNNSAVVGRNGIESAGGAIRLQFIQTTTSIYFSNLTLTNNNADNGGGATVEFQRAVDGNITIRNSLFQSNTAFRGGGLIIFTSVPSSTVNVEILGSMFRDNVAVREGGGFRLVGSDSISYTVFISGLTLEGNRAFDGGGAHFTLSTSTSNVVITNNTFLGNFATFLGAGLSLFQRDNVQTVLKIKKNHFYQNLADFGAGLGIRLFVTSGSNRVTSFNGIIAETDFTQNTATRFGGGLDFFATFAATIGVFNCSFMMNKADFGGGIHGYLISDTSSNCQFEVSRTIISSNKGSGVSLTSCDMVFTDGHTLFINNTTPLNGGGIYLDTNSRLNTIGNDSSVGFINNTADGFGGAIFSADGDISRGETYIEPEFISPCTLGVNMTAEFIGNRANVAGNNLYGGTFFNCNNRLTDGPNIVLFRRDTFKNILECPNVPMVLKEEEMGGVGYKGMPLSSSVSSEPLGVCRCNDNTGINCTSNEVIDTTIFPGQSFTVSLATVGVCGGISPGVVTNNKTLFPLATSVMDSSDSMSSCLQYNYIPEISQISDTNITITIKLSVPNTRLANQGAVLVQLTILPCPLGLVLDPLLRECVCDSVLTTIPGVSCNVSQPFPIQRSGNNWIAFKPDLNCTVAHDGCPFDYCISSAVQFKLNESDTQCNHHRAGTLCGECLPGLSVQLGGNQCADCSSISSIYITLVFLIAGIILVFLILVLNLTVSVGTINGVLFYANVVQLNSSEFGLQGGSVPIVNQFISWINLDLGIHTCFINGLDDYWKVWLQFLFPLYIWVIVIGIILACRYSTRLSKFCNLHPAVPVLATLILMSYTKLLRTLTAIFTYTRVLCGELVWIAWARDGNVHYAQGKHVPLLIVGIVFLILALVYTGLVFSAQWLVRYSDVCFRSTRDPVVKLKPFIDAYTGPYKVKYRFWVGLGLIARLVFTVSFSLTAGSSSNINNVLIMMVVFSMSLFHNKVYRSRATYVLEMLSFFNLFVLALITGTVTKSLTVTIVSISLEVILFVAVILIHLYRASIRKWPKLNITILMVLLRNKLSPNTETNTDSPTPHHPTSNIELQEYEDGVVVNRRDSIIFEIEENDKFTGDYYFVRS